MNKSLILFGAVFGIIGCSTDEVQPDKYSAEVYADNWFALNVNGLQVVEDSVPITTERSFNTESFTFTASRPFVLGLIAKDFKENDTGLEYIGTRRQQMGDGGVILQIRDANGQIVAVSNEGWKCIVTHRAPLDKTCVIESSPVAGEGSCTFETTATPEGWDTADFNATQWPAASVHSESAVSPKQPYYEKNWDSSAKFIWGPDLEADNTVLCRLRIE